MVGHRRPQQYPFGAVQPAVPRTSASRLLARIAQLIDFSVVGARVEPLFARIGRPSIDPVVMVKMMLLGYLFGISTDRRLVDECADRLSFREFLGYGVDEPLPVHSSFTHWRQRLGAEWFRELLHEIVRQCEEHGIALSRARTVDATTVKAQAGRNGPLVEAPEGVDVEQYLEQLFGSDTPALPPPDTPTIAVNTHDPEARLQRKGEQERAQFGYTVSFSADADNGLITDATATDIERAGTAIEHVDEDPGEVDELAADALYDAGETLEKLQERGVTPYIPRASRERAGQISKDAFTYDQKRDVYICPQGAVLEHSRFHQRRRAHFYTARMRDCQSCPLKARCTPAKRRSVSRLETEPAREAAVRSGFRYRYLQRRRRINEHLHRMGKRDHCLTRARSLGLEPMRIQAALTAIAIDLKKLVRLLDGPRPLAAALRLAGTTRRPAGAFALPLICRLRSVLGRLWGPWGSPTSAGA